MASLSFARGSGERLLKLGRVGVEGFVELRKSSFLLLRVCQTREKSIKHESRMVL